MRCRPSRPCRPPARPAVARRRPAPAPGIVAGSGPFPAVQAARRGGERSGLCAAGILAARGNLGRASAGALSAERQAERPPSAPGAQPCKGRAFSSSRADRAQTCERSLRQLTAARERWQHLDQKYLCLCSMTPSVGRLKELLAENKLPLTGYTEKSEMVNALVAAGVDLEASVGGESIAAESRSQPQLQPQPQPQSQPQPQAHSRLQPERPQRYARGQASAAEQRVDSDSIVTRVLSARTDEDVLGVQRGEAAESVRAAFRTLSFAVHPDKCSDVRAAEAFRVLRAAYDRLAALATPAGHTEPAELASWWRAAWHSGGAKVQALAVNEAHAAAAGGCALPNTVELAFCCTTPGCAAVGGGLLLRMLASELQPCLLSQCPSCSQDVIINVLPPPNHATAFAAAPVASASGAASRRSAAAAAAPERAKRARCASPPRNVVRPGPELGLPEGWVVQETTRTVPASGAGPASGGAGPRTRCDKYYSFPALGLRFRSLAEVRRFLTGAEAAGSGPANACSAK